MGLTSKIIILWRIFNIWINWKICTESSKFHTSVGNKQAIGYNLKLAKLLELRIFIGRYFEER